MSHCHVYIITEDGQRVKVGFALSPKRRLRGCQTGNPHELKLHTTYRLRDTRSAQHVERWVHYHLLRHHLRGEWFSVSPERASRTVTRILTQYYCDLNGCWYSKTNDFSDPPELLNTKVLKRNSDAIRNDPEAKAKMSTAAKVRWQRRSFRKKIAASRKISGMYEKVAEQRRQDWENPEYRAKMEAVNQRRMADPAYRQQLTANLGKGKAKAKAACSKQLKNQWEDPAFRQRMSAAMKARWENPEYRKARVESGKQAAAEVLADPQKRQRLMSHLALLNSKRRRDAAN